MEGVMKLGIGSSSSPGPDITTSLSSNQITQLSCSSLLTLLQICLCPQEKKPHPLSPFFPPSPFQCPTCHVFSSNTRVGLCVDLFAHSIHHDFGKEHVSFLEPRAVCTGPVVGLFAPLSHVAGSVLFT